MAHLALVSKSVLEKAIKALSETHCDLADELREDAKDVINCMVWTRSDAEGAVDDAIESGLLKAEHRNKAIEDIMCDFESEIACETVSEELTDWIERFDEDTDYPEAFPSEETGPAEVALT